MDSNENKVETPESTGLTEEKVRSIVEKAIEPFTKQVDERFESLVHGFYNKVTETVKDEIKKSEVIDVNSDEYDF